jgi:hypothetical protein
MQRPFKRICLALFLSAAVCAGGQQRSQEAPPLAIVTESLPKAEPHQPFKLVLQAKGGVPPYRWSIQSGALPAGVGLNGRTGIISGTPAEAGEFAVVITVTDSARPPHMVDRDLKLASIAPLTVEWKDYPQVDADKISGSVEVENGTKDEFDQTVIIVAVNEYHKAFALGYQRFTLEPEKGKIEIPFGSTLPRGQYVIHADAVAEVERKRRIFRGRLQTAKALAVTVP